MSEMGWVEEMGDALEFVYGCVTRTAILKPLKIMTTSV